MTYPPFLATRGGPGGVNNGYVDLSHVGAAFFLTEEEPDGVPAPGVYPVYIRLKDGSNLADYRADSRTKALTRVNTIRRAVEDAYEPISDVDQ
jgi:hypothetical protein